MSERLTDEQLRKMASWNTKPECLSWMAAELAALRAENERLREALRHARRWASCDADKAGYPQPYHLVRVAFLDAALSGETAETTK